METPTNKSLAIGTIITLLLQTGGIVWWASGLDSRVKALEESSKSYVTSSELRAVQTTVDVQITAINTNIANINRDVREIRNFLVSGTGGRTANN